MNIGIINCIVVFKKVLWSRWRKDRLQDLWSFAFGVGVDKIHVSFVCEYLPVSIRQNVHLMNSDKFLHTPPFVDTCQVITFQSTILRIRDNEEVLVSNGYELPVHCAVTRDFDQSRILMQNKTQLFKG